MNRKMQIRGTRRYCAAVIALSLSGILLGLTGCHGRTLVDAWEPLPAPAGLAWHNEACQQTAFDRDSDGRVDRLRFWIGSGLAEELIDNDLDGWFDTHLFIVYGKDGDRKPIHQAVPAVPVTHAPGSFERPRSS